MLRFPFAGIPRKNISRPQAKKYIAASGLVTAKQIIPRHWQAGPAETKLYRDIGCWLDV
jgi:hypothetical protein